MRVLIACIKKDLREFLRYRKNILCTSILMIICIMVLAVTNIFPMLLTQLLIKSPNLVSDSTVVYEMFTKMFPTNIRGSLGIVASDIGTFYTIVVVLICHSILPTEIREGKWIIPINTGISGNNLVASKSIVYSIGMSLPVFVIMNIYYYTASFFLENNITWIVVLINSIVLACSIAFIVAMTIMTSIIYKHSSVVALFIIFITLTAPDILTMFSFGKWFPTYLLTFVYNTESNIGLIFIPLLAMVCILIISFVLSVNKCKKIEINR